MPRRTDLESIYESDADAESKRRAKKARFAVLQEAVVARLEQAGHDPGGWKNGELNNARLVPLMLYQGRLPEFRSLLERCERDLECFYAKARELAGR